MSNVNSNIQILADEIYRKYDEQKASRKIGELLQRIAHGNNYKTIYEYAREIGLGDIFKEVITAHDYVMEMEDYNEISKEFMRTVNKYASDINDMAELVQKSLNDSMGINIKPQRVNVDQNAVKKLVDEIINGIPTNYEDVPKLDGLEGMFSTFGAELTDEIIKKNAEIQAKSGFNIVLIRKYDDVGIHNYANYSEKRKSSHPAEVCQFCQSLEGAYNYADLDANSRVWRRHKGCTCSIDLVNKGMSERVYNYR